MTTHIPQPGDWKIKSLTIMASQNFSLCRSSASRNISQKGARTFTSGEKGQEFHVEPKNALTKRTAAA